MLKLDEELIRKGMEFHTTAANIHSIHCAIFNYRGQYDVYKNQPEMYDVIQRAHDKLERLLIPAPRAFVKLKVLED